MPQHGSFLAGELGWACLLSYNKLLKGVSCTPAVTLRFES